MDPFVVGIVGIGIGGGALLLVTFLEHKGFTVNQTAIKIVMEACKYGGILWLLKEMFNVFL